MADKAISKRVECVARWTFYVDTLMAAESVKARFVFVSTCWLLFRGFVALVDIGTFVFMSLIHNKSRRARTFKSAHRIIAMVVA